MFFDQLENLPRYQGVHKNIDTAIEYLMTHDLSSLDLGRYDVDEDRVRNKLIALNFMPDI